MTQIVQKSQKIGAIRDLMVKMKDQIAMAAPRHLTADRIIRVAMTSIQQTPKLLECSQESLLACLLTCTQIGLEVDGASQKAHLVPYGSKCTLILGFRGMMELARRSEDVLDINLPQCVYENDEFEYELGSRPTLTHKPARGERGAMTHVYCVAVLKSGERPFHIMSMAEIEQVKKMATAKMRSTDGPWFTHKEAMAKKTVVRGLCKWLPCSSEAARGISLDEQADAGVEQKLSFFETPDGVEVSKAPETVDDLIPEAAPAPTKKIKKVSSKLVKRRHEAMASFVKLGAERRARILLQFGLDKEEDIKGLEDAELLSEIHLCSLEEAREQKDEAVAETEAAEPQSLLGENDGQPSSHGQYP